MTTPNIKGDNLLGEFPAVSHEDWRRLVEAELKGAPFDKKMLTPTYEGVTLKPLYRREDIASLTHVNTFPGFGPFVRGATASGYVSRPWHVSQEIAVGSPTEFNQAARNSLSRGLNALNMQLDHATRAGHDPDWAPAEDVGFGGLSIATVGDLDRALDGVDLEKTLLFIRSGPSGLAIASLLIALARKRRKTTMNLRGCIEMDPLGVLAHEGRLPQSLDSAYREMSALTRWAADRAPKLQTICVHTRSWHEAGGNAVQELAFSLATGVDYLRAMNSRGLDVNTTAPRVRFAVTVSTSFFLEIAKLRAARMLWARAVAAAGGNAEAQKLALHVRTSQRTKTTRDPHNNMLRVTVEAFAGVLGGCDSMQVGAFDEVIRKPDEFSLRIARNTQLVLQKECSLDHVIDPVGGSWFVESLTADLAARAWALFQEVERQGGLEAALRAGMPQKVVGATAAERIKAAAHRRESIVGVNQYANAQEKPLDTPSQDPRAFHKRRVQQITSHRTGLDDEDNAAVLQRLAKIVGFHGPGLVETCVDAAVSGATLGEITRAVRISDSPCAPITPVCMARIAAPIENLRAAMDRFVAREGARPQVFLCNMGPLKEHKARADFARGFFAVGGYEAISPPGFKTPGEAAQAFGQSGASIAVLCSTDENYPGLVPQLVPLLRAAQPGAILVLAGFPADQVESHRRTGIDEFIHVRANAVEVLNGVHVKLGIS